MKRGFTILELLVASLLLGMLVTVLTMIFNQSSIAWRTGVAGLMDMDEVRDNMAEVRDDADCIYVWGNKLCKTLSIWDEDSSKPGMKSRAIADENPSGSVKQWEVVGQEMRRKKSNLIENKPEAAFGPVENLGQVDAEKGHNWIVNVKSCGPNRVLNDYDDIWSNPDDFE